MPARRGVGLLLNCPGCTEESHGRLHVSFANPLDGGPQWHEQGWQRTGDSFENLSLTPSIRRLEGCKWHGYITNGEVLTCAPE